VEVWDDLGVSSHPEGAMRKREPSREGKFGVASFERDHREGKTGIGKRNQFNLNPNNTSKGPATAFIVPAEGKEQHSLSQNP